MKILEYPDEKSWLEAREPYITASDAANYCGMNKYDKNGPITLWMDKTGLEKRPYIGNKEAVILGKRAEDPVRQLFMLRHPEFELIYNEYGLVVEESEPWAASTLDGLLVHKETGDLYIYEGKTTTVRNAKSFEEWNDDMVPINYQCQGSHQLMTVPEAKGIFFFCWQMISWRDDSNLVERFFSRESMADSIEFCRAHGRLMAKYIETKTRPPVIVGI